MKRRFVWIFDDPEAATVTVFASKAAAIEAAKAGGWSCKDEGQHVTLRLQTPNGEVEADIYRRRILRSHTDAPAPESEPEAPEAPAEEIEPQNAPQGIVEANRDQQVDGRAARNAGCCGVFAVWVLTYPQHEKPFGVFYEWARRALKRSSRWRGSTHCGEYGRMFDVQGVPFKWWEHFSHRDGKARTLRHVADVWAKAFPGKPHRGLIRIRGHVMAYIDGKVIDQNESSAPAEHRCRRCFVSDLWLVES